MINIDFLSIKAFLVENIDFLIGARIQKIQQPTRKDFIFTLRNNSETRKLYININPNIYHIAFMSRQNEEKRAILIPKQPPMFCMLLRKYLEGNKISDALVVDGERIIEFHFDIIDELSQNRSLCLCAELMGKHSNVILYDRKTSLIIGCAHNVGSEKSRYRELQGGLKYIYPPKTDKSLPIELQNQFKNLSSVEISHYLGRENYTPAIKDDKYTLFSELLPNSILQNSVSEMLDNYYSTFQAKINLNNEKTKLSNIVNNELKKVKNSVSKIEDLLKKRDNTEKYRLYGELLTANLYLKADYVKDVELYDYQKNKTVKIALDETKTMNQNAQRYFKLYTKFKNTREKSTKLLDELHIKKEHLENILYSINLAKIPSDLEEISDELNLKEPEKRKNNKINIEKRNIDGFEVYIGKNNRQNDYIISKLADDEDYWFHTKLCAGSHVLLKVREKEPEDSIIFECCRLAREYSSASQPSKVGIIYTRRKFIKKPSGAPPGYVIYKNEKEVLV